MRFPLFVRALFVGAVLSLSAPAVQAAPSASIVIDMRDGRVLQSSSADRRLHPASLTKMMTLYLTFDAIKRGKLRLDQKVVVSRNAARMPASKLYLKAGQRVSIRSLIRATAIKSANDAAMVLAETIGGSQAGFARMMTNQAKRLGMKNSRFKNPHGLTQKGHYSTARDMAILGRHLFYDHPAYYNIFSRKQEEAAGKRIWSTNRLLRTYRGADGIKTGYTRAAGYNLVASAHRGNKRIIAVLFGGKNSSDRARRVSRLLDIGFAKAGGSVRTVRPNAEPLKTASRKGRIVVSKAPEPQIKPGSKAISVSNLVAEVLTTPARAATAVADAVPANPAKVKKAPSRNVTLAKLTPSARTEGRAIRISASRHAPRIAELPRPRMARGKTSTPIPLPAGLGIVPIPPAKPMEIAQR